MRRISIKFILRKSFNPVLLLIFPFLCYKFVTIWLFFITKIQEESEMWKQYELMNSKIKGSNATLSNDSKRYELNTSLYNVITCLIVCTSL